MKTQRLLVVLIAINLGLLAFLLAQTRIYIGWQGVQVWTSIDGSVLRDRALEIIDDRSICTRPIKSTPTLKWRYFA